VTTAPFSPVPIKREIDVDAVPRDEQIDMLRASLVNANVATKTYFVTATDRRLCRVADASGKPQVVPIGQATLTEIATRQYDWVRMRKRDEYVYVDPPATVVRAVECEPGAALPLLRRIVEAPYLTASGRVVDRPGYDDETEQYLHLDQEIEPVPENPSDALLADAVRVLTEGQLGGFVFADAASKANAVAAEITPHVLVLSPDVLTPCFALDAPDNNFGKTTLAQSIVAPLVGREPDVTPMTMSDRTECRRTLFALLRDDPEAIIVDNLRERFAGDALASILTARSIKDRQIKSSTAPAAGNRALWFATGTLMTFSRELAIRSVLVQLVAPPVGSRSPIQWAVERRLEIVRAQLIVMRGWIAAGRPLAEITHPKYPRWAGLVGGVLRVMGIPEMLANQHLLAERDEETLAWSDLVQRWESLPGGPTKPRRVTEIIECAAIAGEPAFDLIEDGHNDLGRAQILGRKLRLRATSSVAISGYVIRGVWNANAKVHEYYLDRVQPSATPPPSGESVKGRAPAPGRDSDCGVCGVLQSSDHEVTCARAYTARA
jgi:hypothetical protein